MGGGATRRERQTGAGLRLQRGRVLKPDGTPQFIDAKGRLLNPDREPPAGLMLYEEEIPRERVRVTRSCQLARWQDGSTHLWIGRRKRIGGGEGSSGGSLALSVAAAARTPQQADGAAQRMLAFSPRPGPIHHERGANEQHDEQQDEGQGVRLERHTLSLSRLPLRPPLAPRLRLHLTGP